jgi:hypothetical protein
MILFSLLCIILFAIILVFAFAIGVGGTLFLIVFGDAIICIWIIVAIIKHCSKKNKK